MGSYEIKQVSKSESVGVRMKFVKSQSVGVPMKVKSQSVGVDMKSVDCAWPLLGVDPEAWLTDSYFGHHERG